MKTSILGDIRAEADREMLGTTFLETADFKTLINNTDRPIVVGRRGTGKSALAYHLIEHWQTVSRTSAVLITPSEDQIIGLRTLIPKFFGDDYKMIRAGTRIAWRYALLAEIACLLVGHYKIGRAQDRALIQQHAREWTALGTDISMRLRKKLMNAWSNLDAGEFIAEISRLLELPLLHNAIVGALNELKHTPAPQGFLGHLIAREYSQEECRNGEARSRCGGGGGSPEGDLRCCRERPWGTVFGPAQARDGAASAARRGS